MRGALQFRARTADPRPVEALTYPDGFCLYLWRSLESPGALYLTGSARSATNVYKELVEDGYIVKVVHMATGVECQLRDGELLPLPVPAGEAAH